MPIAAIFVMLLSCKFCYCYSFSSPSVCRTTYKQRQALKNAGPLFAASSSSEASVSPQAISSGYSTTGDLTKAIQEATELALQSLPEADETSKIDLAVISVSSLYDGTFSPSIVVPSLLDVAASFGAGIQNVIGSSAGGVVSSLVNIEPEATEACIPVEIEGSLGVSVTLFMLPDVELKTFHVLGDDVPDDYGRVPPDTWKQAVGLTGFGESNNKESLDAPVFMLIPSPGFQKDLDDLLQGLQVNFPNSKTFGALASTVSSLSKARLFRYDASDPQGMQTFGDGCVGIGMTGDIDVRTMVAQGAKPVGGIYQILKATGSTINAIVLDETATELEREASDAEGLDDEEEHEDEFAQDKQAQMAAAYAKASIPKPCLAEANFLMRTLSDDDQAFMKKALLVGLEKGGSVGRTPSELARLKEGQGHRFQVMQVASAGMKDGSITLPLGSVDVQPGTRMRFFVRESSFAKKEVQALWMGYKKKVLQDSFNEKSDDDKVSFKPTGCFVLPTLDRGSKFFKGKPGYESGTVTTFIPKISSVAGFFSNGVIMKLDEEDTSEIGASTHGSASGYVLFGSSKYSSESLNRLNQTWITRSHDLPNLFGSISTALQNLVAQFTRLLKQKKRRKRQRKKRSEPKLQLKLLKRKIQNEPAELKLSPC